MVVYFTLTAIAPLLLSSPRLIIRHPALCLRLWLATFIVAATSIALALGLFIALALRHHVIHTPGHDNLGPFIDQLLGWLSIAAVGILAFRMGVAVQDARAAVSAMNGEFQTVLSSARIERLGALEFAVVESEVPLIGARSSRVIVTTAILTLLSEGQLAAVLEHERSHIRRKHARILAIANIAEAIAPALSAGKGFASAARVTAELIADDDAARVYGAAATADAIEIAYPFEPGVAERVQRLRASKF
jgi:Zn-dependent protease with chaperone function